MIHQGLSSFADFGEYVLEEIRIRRKLVALALSLNST